MTNELAIRELERLKQREIDERPVLDEIAAAHVDLAILAIDHAIKVLREFPSGVRA